MDLRPANERWPERNLADNAIDFCAQVLGLSFHYPMHQTTGTYNPATTGSFSVKSEN